jgi:hypothetical protein
MTHRRRHDHKTTLFNFPTRPSCSLAISLEPVPLDDFRVWTSEARRGPRELSQIVALPSEKDKTNKRSQTKSDGPPRQGRILAFGSAVQGLHQLRVSENALWYVLGLSSMRPSWPPVLMLACRWQAAPLQGLRRPQAAMSRIPEGRLCLHERRLESARSGFSASAGN